MNKFNMYWYRFRHWFFQWKMDNDGDIAFVICNKLAFVKYKEHTIINWEGNQMIEAGKYQGAAN